MQDICRIYRISTRTGKRWAAHDRWLRRFDGKRVLYSVDAADASYYRHKGEDRKWRRKARPGASRDTKTLLDPS